MLLSILATSLILTASAQTAQDNLGYYMQPSVRGDVIVFVSQGDLWSVGTGGGLAHALTSHVAPASNPAISRDGVTVAFTGTYAGPNDAYVMPISGGEPKRLTFDGTMNVVGWTPSGEVLAATSSRSTLPSEQLMRIDPKTRGETLVPLAQADDGDYDPSGKYLFFTRFAFQGSHTKRYKGGTAQNIWKYANGAPEAVCLTKSYLGTSMSPMVWDGRIYFLTDRDGTMNLWSMDESGGGLKQLTHHQGWDVQSASLDRGRVVYELGPDLYLYDIVSNTDRRLSIQLASDFDQTRERVEKNPTSYVSSAMPSPDGSKVALTARGQVFVAPAASGRLVEVTRKKGVRYRQAMFSSDGKSILTLSDESGETEWWRFPANGVGKAEQISSGSSSLTMRGLVSPDGKFIAYADKNQSLWICDVSAKATKKIAYCPDGELDDLAWSPDSLWLAYMMPTQVFNRIVVYSVKSGQNTPITTDRADSGSPAWSPDGKWLYFLSDRTFRSVVSSPWGSREPEPYFDKQTKIYQLGLTKGLRSPFQPADELYQPEKPKSDKEPKDPSVAIDLDGIQNRLWEVPVPADNFSQLAVNGSRIFTRRTVDGVPELCYVEVKNQDVSVKSLLPSVSQFRLTQNGKNILAIGPRGIMTLPADGGSPKPVDLSGWTLVVEPKEEWRQMFVEAWRLERDYFYDLKMNSVDWQAMLKRYLPAVDRVRDRSELSNLLGQMISELSALHMFVYGGDNWHGNDSVAPSYLGGVLARDQSLGGYKVDRIYQADPDYPEQLAPLAQPGVDISVGDVITSVNGVDVLSAPDISMLLRNQAGKQVLLSVKDGISGKERQCIVTPIGGGQERDLQYGDWEFSRRRIVETASKNEIGYVHLRAMGSGDIAQWERDFYPAFNRQGLIIDVRHNGGGNIDSWIIEKLMRKAWFYWQPRLGNPSWNMQFAFRGHVVILCDESTASDGEAFTEGIKRLKLGTVIGTRTWGGEIWLSSSNRLVDGGIATAAELGVYGPEGAWLIEGHGVDPDIVIDNLPHATFEGQDAQLQAALEYLAKEIKDHPVPIPKNPAYPNKAFKGDG